jgi:hypothetical protein
LYFPSFYLPYPCDLSFLFPEDITEEARAMALAVYETGERFGANIPIGVLRGSQKKDIKDKEGIFFCPSTSSSLPFCFSSCLLFDFLFL